MIYLKHSIVLVAVVFVTNILTAQTYDVQPDLNNCVPGKLSQETKNQVIKLINDIRARHKLAPVYWNEETENRPQSAALSHAVLGQGLSHDPQPGRKCSTPDSDSGRGQSNLSWSSAKSSPERHIIGWLMDNYNKPPENVGHRRLIINPFLKSTAFGEVYNSANGDWAALWGVTSEAMQPSTCENDFVAYPYENYPPRWVDKSFFLNFCPIPNPNFWYSPGPGSCNLSNPTITMKDEAGNTLQVSNIYYDYIAWGCFANNISWKVVGGLKDSVKYEVTITNITVNGQPKTYNYWFKLTDEPVVPPLPLAKVPVLVAPVNNATNIEAPVVFKWQKSENAVRYRIEGSLGSSFSYIAFEQDNITDTSYTLTSTLSNNATYYWRVKAYNIEDVASDNSSIWTFSTKEIIPDPPVSVFPLVGNNNVARSDTYIWSRLTTALTYNLQISTTNDFVTLAVDQNNIYDTLYQLTEEQMLEEFTTYYWRVKAILISGSETDWSTPIQYTTDDRLNIVEELEGIIITCYPNPFNEYANIILEANNEKIATIEIYNILGIKIAEIHNGMINNGINNFKFKPVNDNIEVYFCKIKIENNYKIIPLNFIKE